MLVTQVAWVRVPLCSPFFLRAGCSFCPASARACGSASCHVEVTASFWTRDPAGILHYSMHSTHSPGHLSEASWPIPKTRTDLRRGPILLQRPCCTHLLAAPLALPAPQRDARLASPCVSCHSEPTVSPQPVRLSYAPMTPVPRIRRGRSVDEARRRGQTTTLQATHFAAS